MSETNFARPEARQRFHPQEISGKNDLTEFFLTLIKNSWPGEDSREDQIKQAMAKAQKAMRTENTQERPDKYFAIKDGGNIVATARLEKKIADNKPRGYFGLSSIDPEYRGQKLSTLMSATCEEAARAAGCEVIDSSARLQKPVAIAALLGAGYRITGFNFNAGSSENGYFNFSKSLGAENRVASPDAQSQQVQLSAIDEITKLLNGGWEGTKISNPDPTNDDWKNWLLTFEKTK